MAEREPSVPFERLLEVEQADIHDRFLKLLFALAVLLAWVAALRWAVLYVSSRQPGANFAPLYGLLPALALAYALRRRVSLVVGLLLAGLGLAVTFEAVAHPGLLPLLLYGPLVVLIGAVASTPVLLASSAACGAAIAVLSANLADPVAGVVAASASLGACGVAAWIASRPIYDSLNMALYNASDAARARDELQQQRLHLAQSVKMLDEALYRQSRLSTSLILAHQQAEEARQLKVRFANMISHEIRTPLNIIISFSEVMANSPETYGVAEWPPSLGEDVNEIYRSGKHLLGLINDVLELAQVEANRVVLKKESVPVLDVVQQAVALTRGWFDHAGLYLKVDVAGEVPGLMIDRVRIRQVLLNLLSNARHYTASGGVTVQVERLREEVVISVRDTGIGISKDNLAHLFDEFQRFGEAVDDVGGTGLGLSISRLFIQLHGGRMWAESAGVPGLGTSVSFSLPVTPSRAVNEPAPNERDSVYWQSRYDQARSERVILLAADDPTVQQVTGRLLANLGRVVTSSVAGAPQVMAAHQPDAVVILTGSEMSVESTVAALRSFPVPVVVCRLDATGDHRRTDGADMSDVNGWLVKPITRDDLVSALLSVAPNARLVMSVEDDAQMARFYQVSLAREKRLPNSPGVVNAYTAGQAMSLLEERRPDAVLLDLNLGDSSGWDVLKQIRKRWSKQQLPVIVVTAMDRYGLPLLQARNISVSRAEPLHQHETVLCLQSVLEAVME